MKQFFKFFFASFLALIVGGLVLFAIFFAIIGAIGSSITSGINQEEKVFTQEKSILMIELKDHYQELGQNNMLALITGGASQVPGLKDVLNSIEYAQKDDKIKGIYLKINGSSNGLASAEQIRQALKDFKSSGKFIYAYGDYISQGDYFISSVADSIFINPLGSVEIKGLASEIMFFKGALDKLEVQPEIFYCGDFKSATEPFRMKKMSDPNRKQLAALQEDIWSQYLNAFAEHTKADPATIDSWAQKGLIQNAQDALQYKLIDGLKYKDQIETLLKEKTGLKEDEDVRFSTIADYSRNLPVSVESDQIALLVAEGEIVDGEGSGRGGGPQIASETFIKEIRKIKKNDKIKAVVLRINSPGGSALASEVILRELALLKEKKPIVVSMGDLAASGGYYIASNADSIFALPTTITGSIGVFGMMFNTKALFNNKLGITFDGEKNAPFADFPNMTREMTQQEKTFIQNGVDSIYLTFKTRVSTGRKMDISYVDSIGQGRIWSGLDGLNLGLVDAIGGFDRAFKSAASLAKLDKYRIVTYPEADSKLERLFKSLGKAQINELVMAEQLLQKNFGVNYRWLSTIQKMQENKNHLWMMLPFVPEIK